MEDLEVLGWKSTSLERWKPFIKIMFRSLIVGPGRHELVRKSFGTDWYRIPDRQEFAYRPNFESCRLLVEGIAPP